MREHNGKTYEEKSPHDFNELREIIAILRGEDGCKWDKAQDFDSMKKCLTDETAEVLSAVDNKDYDNLCEELGDVLLQVLLYSQIASEMGLFTLDDVMQGLGEKLIRRHPHVFGDAVARTPEESLALWKEIKAKEKEMKRKKEEGKSL